MRGRSKAASFIGNNISSYFLPFVLKSPFASLRPPFDLSCPVSSVRFHCVGPTWPVVRAFFKTLRTLEMLGPKRRTGGGSLGLLSCWEWKLAGKISEKSPGMELHGLMYA